MGSWVCRCGEKLPALRVPGSVRCPACGRWMTRDPVEVERSREGKR